MKLKGYRIYSFTNTDIEGKKIIDMSEKELRHKEIRLSENVLIKAFKLHKNEEFKDNMIEKDIIKVMLDNDIDIALEQCRSLEFQGKEYGAWFATPNMMKKEDPKSKSKCEMYFINKDYISFAMNFEYQISLGKIKNFYGKERVISKDLARISLATSSAFKTNLKPNIIILPECSHTIESDIVTIIDEEVKEITKDTDELLQKHRLVDTTPFDGCGVCSMEFADMIRKEIGVDYPVSFAGIRMYNGLAVKGLVTSIDFEKYFNEFYEGDIEYFKKENGKFYIKDMYEEWQDVSKVDMILNATQCKWAEEFENMDEINELLNSKEFEKYNDLLSSLYITKVNKKDTDIKEYSLSNYQLLGNLSITEKEMKKLSNKTEEIYQRIIDGDEDYIRLFWGDIIKNYDVDSQGNIIIEESSSSSTQAQELLEINSEFIKSGYVKKVVGRMITKKIKQLAGGKFYIKGNFKTLTQDPITYLDWIMNRNSEKLTEKKNGLDFNKFYCSNIDDGEIRTISRNPLNSFSEILNVEHQREAIIDNYIGHFSKEIYVFNAYDLTAQIASGADFDLDMAFIVDEEIIKNSVVKDLPFINIEDGAEKKYMEFNRYNRLKATIKASGNLIGSLAMRGAGVSNLATFAGYRMYRNSKDNEVYDYDHLIRLYFKSEKIKKEDKTFEKFLNKIEKNFEYMDDYFTEAELKEQIKKSLYKDEYRRDSYRLRNLQMQAIDAPKTLSIPEIPDDLKGYQNPRYLKYHKDHLNNKNTKNYRNALNLNATRIAQTLYKEDIKLKGSSDNLNLIKKYLSCNTDAWTYNEEYGECKEKVKELYEKYKNEVQKSNYDIKMGKSRKKEKEELKDEKSSYRRKKIKEEYEIERVEIKEKYLEEKLIAEKDSLFEADKIIETYKKELISHALVNLKCSESFIFKYFFKAVAEVLKKNSINIPSYVYIEDKNGDIEYLGKRFRREKSFKHSSKEKTDKLHFESRIQANKKLIDYKGLKHKARLCITNKNIDIEKLKSAYIGTQVFRDNLQPILLDNNREKVGYIYPEYNEIDDFMLLTDFKDRLAELDIVKISNNGATIVLNL